MSVPHGLAQACPAEFMLALLAGHRIAPTVLDDYNVTIRASLSFNKLDEPRSIVLKEF